MAKKLTAKRVAVTGSAGFIGSYLARKLITEVGLKPEQIISVDKPENFIMRRAADFLRDQYIPNKSPEVFLQKLSELKPDLIFHMGACSSTEETNWDYLMEVNVNYSKALWNYCVENQVEFYYASSAATYGDGTQGFDDASDNFDSLKPLNLYGKSKLLFDQYVTEEVMHHRTPPQWAGFKFFNVYGPFEDHKKGQASVIHHAAHQLRANGVVKLFKSHHPDYEDGKQQRDFVYVGDLKNVLFHFAQNKVSSGIYNLGTGKAQTFLDLVEAVAEALNVKLKVEFIPTPEKLREHYQYFTEAKMEKLTQALGGQHQATFLKEGAKLTLLEDV